MNKVGEEFTEERILLDYGRQLYLLTLFSHYVHHIYCPVPS